MSYLPWWGGGAALAAVSLAFWILQNRTLGVSGALERVVFWRADREARLTEQAMVDQAEAVERAMLEATREAFGPEALEAALAQAGQGPASVPKRRVRPAGSVHLVFLLCLALGGVLGAALRGQLALQTSLGPEFEGLFSGWGLAALFGGGLLVGFGTRMAGGCTSGHGLVGCSRGQPGSLLATALFFGTGIGVSLLLEGLK